MDNVKSTLSYFYASFILCIIALFIGYEIAGVKGALITGSITIIETIFSFDNAVVNASILKHWDQKWRNLFMWVGMPIAVFGMRFFFPLLIVSVLSGLSIIESFTLATHEPQKYAAILTSSHHEIVAYGGAFLILIVLNFFMDGEKDTHWVTGIEPLLAKVSNPYIKYVVASGAVGGLAYLLQSTSFLYAGLAGIATYVGIEVLHKLLGDGDGEAGGNVVKQGIIGLLYLEILDASFSFDGVIGAFALTDIIIIITVALAAGAMFVRSFTLLMVDRGTLDTYRYMENAAFVAIAALVVIMFTGLFVHVGEAITAFISTAIIVAGIVHSIVENRKEQTSA